MLRKVNDILAGAEQFLIGLDILVMTAMAFLQVLSRYVFKTSYPWLEEAVRLLMFWLTYLGVPLLIYKSNNVAIDFIPEAVEKKFKFSFAPILNLIVLMFVLYFLSQTFTFLKTTMFYNQKSQVMSIPMVLVYSVFAIGNILAVFHSVSNFIFNFMDRRKNL